MNTAMFEKRACELLLTWCVFALLQASQFSLADEFKLKDGRVVVGQVRIPPKKDAPQWTVELASGTSVRFPSTQVEMNGHVKSDEKSDKYRQSLANVQPTAESHAGLAGWCLKNGMREQALAHYRRALDFDPDNATAQSAIGFIKDDSGRWVDRDWFMTEVKGKVKIDGKYEFAEVYAFKQANDELKLNVAKWNRPIEQMQKDIVANGKKSAKALADLMQINDPFAIPVFGAKLLEADTPNSMKKIYIQLLSQAQMPEAVGALVQATLNDNDLQVRDACLDSLSRFGREYAIASYIGVLLGVAGKNQDSPATAVRANRAAAGLNALKAENAILPLIGALVTKYKVTRTPQGNYNVAGGLTTPGKPETTIESAQNGEVLGALVKLTGKNFSYDEKLWMNWYASVYAAPMGDLRRDP